jgi:DNA end-binding protein Ku
MDTEPHGAQLGASGADTPADRASLADGDARTAGRGSKGSVRQGGARVATRTFGESDWAKKEGAGRGLEGRRTGRKGWGGTDEGARRWLGGREEKAVAARAIWKGTLRIAEVSCRVALHAAASTSERVSLNLIDRRTGAPLRREYVDAETGEVVQASDQVRGYEVGHGRHVVLSPEEMALALPESDKTLRVETFLACSDVDTTYLDRPYYVAPAGAEDAPAVALIRDGMRAEKSVALARTVLFRRVRTLLIRPHGPGLIANTLNFDYEVTPAREAFADVPDVEVEAGMLDLARRVVRMRSGVSIRPPSTTATTRRSWSWCGRRRRAGRSRLPRRRRRRSPGA